MSLIERTGFIGGLLLLVRRSLRQHALSTFVTVCSTALAGGLVMSVFALQHQSRAAFEGGPVGFDAVLGARGSQVQLVLNAVYHLETSPGNIPWEMYTALRKNPAVSLAIPYAVGDNYYGYRIVGTTDEIFTKFEYQKGRKFETEPGGRFFDPKRREAVVGGYVARKLGLQVGSIINPFHGLAFDPKMKHDEEYVVSGILKPTNSPSDRVIWIPIEGIFRMGGHVLRGTGENYVAEAGKEIEDKYKEVSCVMIKLRSQAMGFTLDQQINKQGKVATLAYPIGKSMAELFEKFGWVNRVLLLVAYLVILVAAGSILASIYNSINERRREFAILRSLGARRGTVFSSIVIEAGVIAFMGSILGWVVYAAIFAAAAVIVRQQTGVVMDVAAFHPSLVAVPLAMTGIGALAGVVPALKAYATDVATNLQPVS